MKINKSFVLIAAIIATVLGGCLIWDSWEQKNAIEKTGEQASNGYKNAEFEIEGQKVKLSGGISETETAPGSASKTVTRYFGNELKTDLDGDSREDVVFLLTQETGGSGVFFYAVAALNKESGYIGSDGYFLGDRIAPQSTVLSQNPNHKEVIVVNYADRLPEEPMSAEPSVGKSVYLKIDRESYRWGVVIPDFEGESR